MLGLYEGPRLFDDEQPSQLEAEVMYVTLKTGDLNARHEVRHTFEGLAEDATGQGGTAPVVIGSDRLEYDAGRRGGAILRASPRCCVAGPMSCGPRRFGCTTRGGRADASRRWARCGPGCIRSPAVKRRR